MKNEMAFLKYRQEVVQSWPESDRKAVFKAAIESRICSVPQRTQEDSFRRTLGGPELGNTDWFDCPALIGLGDE